MSVLELAMDKNVSQNAIRLFYKFSIFSSFPLAYFSLIILRFQVMKTINYPYNKQIRVQINYSTLHMIWYSLGKMRNTFKRPSQLPRMKNNSVLQMSYLTNCDFHTNTNS